MKTSLELSNWKLQLIWLSKFKTAMNFLQIDPQEGLLVQSILPGQTPALNDSITIGPFSLHRPPYLFIFLSRPAAKRGRQSILLRFPFSHHLLPSTFPTTSSRQGPQPTKKTDNTSSQALTRDLFLRICLSHPPCFCQSPYIALEKCSQILLLESPCPLVRPSVEMYRI